ncbi:hypothetical protein LUZ60_014387 [Juncus effusus]|nr:hypothetical protein LUZ60_014387 [Juncus effusus]
MKFISLKFAGLKEQNTTKYPVNPRNANFNRVLLEEETDSEYKNKPDSSDVEAKYTGDEEENEWIAEPEPGVLITLVQLPNGGNLLKKISFSKEYFDTWAAESWWRENWDRLVGLYTISQISSLQTPYPSDQEYQFEESGETSGMNSCDHQSGSKGEDFMAISETETEIEGQVAAADWVVEDEPGVFLTLRLLPDGFRELVRVELLGEKFGQVKAIVWWEENKERLEKLYSQKSK